MISAICPHCNTATSLQPIQIDSEYAFLVEDSSEKSPKFGHAKVTAITDDDSPHYTSFGIFECQVCGKRFAAKRTKYADNNWIPIYPIPHKIVSDDIPEPIKSNFEEANLCFSVRAYRASTAMCQIALEAVWRNLDIPDLKSLEEKGLISKTLKQRADEIRLWGNVVKHEEITEPITNEDCEQLIAYLNSIIERVFIEPKRFERLKGKRNKIEKA
jgi:hypothetical protein